ncbi:MAG: segregation/condensation protein A [Gaiellaceae bacterium]
MIVHELELNLDAFEGPFDLLLTLLLREELEPADVDMADIVVAFVERLAERASRPSPVMPPASPDAAGGAPPAAPEEREVHELDLEACGEFLVLIAALLELKARALFPDEEAELGELEPEEAAEELARRLAEYRRMKEAAAWLTERLAGERDRYFRVGPAPLAPRPERKLAPQDPEQLGAALRLLAQPAPQVSLAHMSLRFPPVSQFLERFRALLRRRRRFDFDAEVGSLPRVDQAVAFLALLELCKAGEIALEQSAAFAPIRVSRPAAPSWPASAPAGQSPAPPLPDAADGAPAVGPYSHTVPPAYAPPATAQEAAVEREQETTNENERTAEWIARSA